MRVKLPIPEKALGEVQKFRARSVGPWIGPPHRHAELELNLVTRGHATYVVQSRRVSISADTAFWLFPGQDHLLLKTSPDMEMWVAVFRPTLLRRVIGRSSPRGEPQAGGRRVLLKSNPTGQFSRILPHASALRLDALLAMLADVATPTDERNAGMSYLLASAWRSFAAARDVPEQSDLPPIVERAAFLLRDDPATYDLPKLADEAGASPAWLSRIFLRHMGVTITDFRNRQRIARFLNQYTSGHRQNLLETSLAAGFNSYAQFYRVFKQSTGFTPAGYRRHLAGRDWQVPFARNVIL